VNEFDFEKEREKLISEFKKVDKNNNGILTKEEMIKAYEKCFPQNSVSRQEILNIFHQVDLNNDGEIHYSG
jgi:Ca2+-binding EF-hand superfamily protein